MIKKNTSFFTRGIACPRTIILEAILGEVPSTTYSKVMRCREIESIEDLSTVLSKKEYDLVLSCIQEEFFRQVIWYMVVFDRVIGRDRCNLESEGFCLE